MNTNNVIDAIDEFRHLIDGGLPADTNLQVGEQFTLLTATGDFSQTKRFEKVGRVIVPVKTSATMPKWFVPEMVFAPDFATLEHILRSHADNPRVCIIRGVLKDDIPDDCQRTKINGGGRPSRQVRRTNASIDDTRSYWLPIDIDSLDDMLFDNPDWQTDPAGYLREVIRTALPKEFHQAGCVYQFSSSHGIKDGVRVHFYFRLTEPLTSADLKRWFANTPSLQESKVDPKFLQHTQVNYIASPEFIKGAIDPIPERVGVLAGGEVELVIPNEVEDNAASDTFRKLFDIPFEEPYYQVSFNKVLQPENVLTSYDYEYINGKWLSPSSESGTPGVNIVDGKIFSHHDNDILTGKISTTYQAFVLLRAEQIKEGRLSDKNLADELPSPEMQAEVDADNLGRHMWRQLFDETNFTFSGGGGFCIGNIDKAKGSCVMGDAAKFKQNFQEYSVSKTYAKRGANGFVIERKPRNPAEDWMKTPGHRQYNSIDVHKKGETPDGEYNMWEGFAVEPQAGSWGLFRSHLSELACDGDEEIFEWLLNWLGCLVQNPGQPIGTVPIFVGDHGTGKSTITDIIRGLFKPAQTKVEDRPGGLGRKFNSAFIGKVFVAVEEQAMNADSHMNRIQAATQRSLITSPYINIEPKGIDPFEIRNTLNFMMTADFNGVPVLMKQGERRYMFFELDKRYQEDKAYFGAMKRQMFKEGGLEAMLYELLERKVNADDVRSTIKTEAYGRVVYESGDYVTKWLHDLVRVEKYPSIIEGIKVRNQVFYRCGNGELFDHFVEWCIDNHIQSSRIGEKTQFLFNLHKLPGCKRHETKRHGHQRYGVSFPSIVELRKLLNVKVI